MPIELRKADDVLDVRDADLPDVPNGAEDTVYTVRLLTPQKLKELRTPYIRYEFSKKTHQKEEQPLSDADAVSFADDITDWVVQKWTGVTYQGEALPCTREYKVMLDPVRRNALNAVAGLNQSKAAEDARKASFRPA